MSGYLRALDTTGCEHIDAVVWAVIAAGDAYHHTDGWGDPGYGGGPSRVDRINAITKRSADIVVGIQAENARLREALNAIGHAEINATSAADALTQVVDLARSVLVFPTIAPAADTAEKPEGAR